MAKALVFIASGFEEIELTSVVDILRRCNIEVIIAGLKRGVIEGAHGIKITSDKSADKVNLKIFDAVIVVGGPPGTENLQRDKRVRTALKKSADFGKITAAICAAPSILSDIGLLKGKTCTIYPGMEKELKRGGGKFKDESSVVVDGKIITSRGPATAIPFALKIAEKLVDLKTVRNVKKRVLANLAFK